MKNILRSPSQLSAKEPGPEFSRPSFDSAIWAKGYNITVEKALKCPCCSNAPLIDCQNCFGTGYFYINPTKTRGLITGVNRNDKYERWSQELLGTVSVTVTDNDKINMGYFDRITIDGEISYFSEKVEVRGSKSFGFFCFLTYKPINILSVHAFDSSAKKLIRIDDFGINPNNPYSVLLRGIDDMPFSGVVSIYYKHEIEYHVLDFPHEVRASWAKNKSTGELEKIQLPIQAIARRSHLIAMEVPNYDGSGVVVNDNI